MNITSPLLITVALPTVTTRTEGSESWIKGWWPRLTWTNPRNTLRVLSSAISHSKVHFTTCINTFILQVFLPHAVFDNRLELRIYRLSLPFLTQNVFMSTLRILACNTCVTYKPSMWPQQLSPPDPCCSVVEHPTRNPEGHGFKSSSVTFFLSRACDRWI